MAPESDISQRIEFARSTINSIEWLHERMDQKASFALVISALLSNAFVTLMRVYLQPEHLVGPQKYLIGVLLGWFLYTTAAVVWWAIATWKARDLSREQHKSKSNTNANTPRLVAEQYDGKPEEYCAALAALTPEQILADYGEQISHGSGVSASKVKYVNRTLAYLRWSMVPWIAGVLVIFVNQFLRTPPGFTQLLILTAIALIPTVAGSFIIKTFGPKLD